MTIALCASLIKAHHALIKAKHQLEELGHQVILPWTTELIYQGKMSFKDIPQFKKKHGPKGVTRHFNNIKSADAILVINSTAKGIQNYIGANTLMEMGFAHYLKKPIYLLNPIPKISYYEEIRDVQPIILKGDLKKIKIDS